MPRDRRALRLLPVGIVAALVACIMVATAQPVSTARRQTKVPPIVFSRSNEGATLFAVRPDGRRLRRLTRIPSDSDPAWSPNGKLVAFETHGGRTGTPKIAVMRANGSGRRLLTRGTAFDLDPAWSPDGTRIVFARVQPRSGADGQVISLYVIRPNGTGLRRLTEGAEDWTAAWSPDGRRIAFARVLDRDYGDGCEAVYSAINVMDADGSNVRRLSVGDRPQDSEPSWSPDGRRIAFSSRRDRNGTTSFEDCRYNGEIYVMGADGSDVRRLTQNTADDSGPDWSPDGRRLVYSSGHSDAESGNAGPWLYVMPVDGGTRRRITRGTGWDTAPDWRASSVQP